MPCVSCDLHNMLEVCTDGDAYCDVRPMHARWFDKFGNVDVKFAEDMVAGFVPLTSMIPSSLTKPGNTQHNGL